MIESPRDDGDAIAILTPEDLMGLARGPEDGALAHHFGAALRKLAGHGLLTWAGDASPTTAALLMHCGREKTSVDAASLAPTLQGAISYLA